MSMHVGPAENLLNLPFKNRCGCAEAFHRTAGQRLPGLWWREAPAVGIGDDKDARIVWPDEVDEMVLDPIVWRRVAVPAA
eukprot:7258098-Prymnesium_polylepis.1